MQVQYWGAHADLAQNQTPHFTRSVIRQGLLCSNFVLVDVGVQGGIDPRWQHLGDRLEIYGFDAVEEAIEPLRRGASSRAHYYATGLGNEDGERDLFVASETTASSFYHQSQSQYDVDPRVGITAAKRRVPIRRLDSLLATGEVAQADFLKIDCEGFEPEVLKGASTLLRGVQALEIETNFSTSPKLPLTHFWAVYENLLPHGFLVYDLAYNRVPRASFIERGKVLEVGEPTTVARPATFNVLFFREGAATDLDQLIKRAAILELYGLRDVAFDILNAEALRFPSGAAVKKAADLLVTGRLVLPSSVRKAAAELGRALRNSIVYRLRFGNR